MKQEEFNAIGDNTLHSITHVGNVPFKLGSREKSMFGDVLHVLTISNSLVPMDRWLTKTWK